jgi:hypothetical protein
MKKNRLVAAGLLAGGIALTGLTGSAYAAGTTPAAKDTGKGKVTRAAKGHGPVAIACVGKSVKIKGKPEKSTFSVKKPGKRPVTIIGGKLTAGKRGGDAKGLPAPPPGAKVLKLKALKDGAATAKLRALPKGVHCFSVKPGTPGGPPPTPAR